MVELRGQRGVVWAAPVVLVLVVAVAAAVLVLRGGDDTTPGAASTPDSSTSSAAPSPVAPTTEVDPDTWCAAFLEFADAQAQYVGAPDDPAAESALQDKADALLAAGRPSGLSAGGVTSLQVLVDGALSQAGDPTLAPDTAPEDPQAFAAYLSANCPA